MRQALGPKKVEKLRQQTGLDIVKVMVRGNTGHRRDLCLADGTVVCLWPDGTTTKEEGHIWDANRAGVGQDA